MDHSSAAAQPAQTVQAPAQEQTGTTHHAPYTGPVDTFFYDNAIVRLFVIATVVFGLIGMLVGVLIAVQLYYPDANFGLSFTTYGRIRPLHTNAIIFAFVGNAIFAGVYYSLQRLLKARMFSDMLSRIHFWGWQLIILAAAITLPLGYTTSHEYAELEWPIDIAITIIWLVFGINMIGTMMKRRVRHLYVAIWFYIATFVTVALLHVVNSVELPISFLKSYYVYAGVQDALVQWWYGHNAVAFFLTTPYLGLMYYFLVKAANRPVYSYKLSIIHFWSLIFIYIWAGPHHLLYSSLPDWAQNLGIVFSIMLIAPSWGGMLNGLLTLRGAWDRVQTDPVLKFMVVAVTGYGMATLEGPMLSLKSVNAIAHFTDWIPAHVHVGTLAWNGFLTFGMLYWMWPRMFGTKLFSNKLANAHFWIGTLGIVFWVIPMYFSGFTQGLMWDDMTPEGTLVYKNFLDTTTQILPMHMLRSLGGLFYLIGAIIMVVNLWKTATAGKFIPNEKAEAAPLGAKPEPDGKYAWHRIIERKPMQLTILSLVAVTIGGAVEFLPAFLIDSNVKTISSVQPYTPLELHGRDLYIREGCVGCHSQQVRPFRSEVVRYRGIHETGQYSRGGEYVYDHPFLWGSRRTGPDLHRLGGKYPDSWHFNHMYDPTITSPGSIMPPYPWLVENTVDLELLPAKIRAMQQLGVPYPEGYDAQAEADYYAQADSIVKRLDKDGIPTGPDAEIVAMIAYLQRLGTDIMKASPEELNATPGIDAPAAETATKGKTEALTNSDLSAAN